MDAADRLARLPNWIAALAPLAVVALLAGLFLAFDPIGSLREVPPVEEVAIERTVLREHEIVLHLRNDGPDPVTVAQVLVNDAYWGHEISDRTLSRLETATLRIPYPWDEGMPLAVALITATGVTIEHEIEAASLTPEPGVETIAIYALLGVYIGVVPVAIGLLWFPALRRASRRAVTFVLAFTVGLLLFLLVDTVVEGLELAAATAAVLDGIGLFAIGALGAVIALFFLEAALERRRAASERGTGPSSLAIAYLIAAGIGLHNMGEGLAVGAALAAGEVALGTFLVLGFALHNTTEGLAIVAPLGGAPSRPHLGHFALLGVVAGVPTILGGVLGGFAFAPAPGALAFGLAAGAIAQVVWIVGRGMSEGRGLTSAPGALGLLAGLAVMYATGLLVAA